MRRLILGYAAVALVAVALLGVLLRFLLREAPGSEAASPQAVTAAILADLARPAAAAPAATDPLAAMSADVLADLGPPRAAALADTPLTALVRGAAAEGQSPAYIDALVNDAAARGTVAVPADLRTTEGRVDTPVLLAALGLAGDGAGEGDLSGSDLAADPVSAALDSGPAGYLVLPGDSLSALALRYYGDAGRAAAIHAANAGILVTADSLRAGQTLVLPAR